MNANSSPQPAAIARPAPALRARETLSFKLSLGFLFLLLLLLCVSAISGELLLHRNLRRDALRSEQDSGLRLATQFSAFAAQVEDVAKSMAATAVALDRQPEALRQAGAALLDSRAELGLNGIGIWPEAGALRPGVERASLLWLLGDNGRAQLRLDYNDPRVAPYWREKWYTPPRYLDGQRCYWTLTAKDPLSKSNNLLCSLPLLRLNRFIGVVSVSLPLSTVLRRLDELTQGDPGYALLLDADNQLIANSGPLAAQQPKDRLLNLAGLAQQNGAYNVLALALHERKEDLQAGFARSALARMVPTLQGSTRDLSAQEAQIALLQVWLAAQQERLWRARTGVVELGLDPVLGEPAYASVFELSYPGWRLVRISPSSDGFVAADGLFLRSLAVLGLTSLVLVLIIYVVIKLMVLRPLARMVQQMSETGSSHDTLSPLSHAGRVNELGLLAHWHNERLRQLRDISDRNTSLHTQLASEGGERRKLQDTLARLQERHAQMLQSLEEAVVTVDEAGRIEDMNPAAEHLGATSLRSTRGKSFGEVFVLLSGDGRGQPTDLAQLATERGTRIEQAEDLRLSVGGSEIAVSATVTPMRARNNRVVGAVLVLRTRGAGAAARGAPAAAGPQADSLTGLPDRGACERRVRELIEGAKVAARTHALLWLDVDQLAKVNDSGGAAAGDAVLARLSELLLSLTGGAGDVYRVGSDSFALLLGNSTVDRARTFGEALRRTVVATRFIWEGRQFGITVSIGLCEFGAQSESPADVLRTAQEACKAAKRAGRNTLKVYEPSMSRFKPGVDDPVWETRIRNGLHHGLLHVTSQLLQPQRGSAVEGAGYELQLALEDEEGFWTAAPGFMPAAERLQLAAELDRWLLQRALELLSAQPRPLGELAFAGLALSAASLQDPRLLEQLGDLLARHPGVAPSTLCFIVDQEVLLQYPQAAQSTSRSLRSLGCRLAIDRFRVLASGELAVLRRLPADLVRIDGGNYPAIATETLEQNLAEAALHLARGLGCRTIAHHLDEPRQAEQWRRLGADYLQGNAIARATPLVLSGTRR